MPLCRLKNSHSTMLRKTFTGQPPAPDKHTEDPDKSILLAAANYTLVKADDADEKKLPQEPSHPLTGADIQTSCEGTSPVVTTELTSHEIDANYGVVDIIDQTSYTYASVDKDAKTTKKPSLPARLQCKPPPPVPDVSCQLPDSEILSTYDSIGPNLPSSAVSIEVEDATYSVVDVTNVSTSVDKTSEKPLLPKRPEGKLPPPIPGRSPTTELTSQDIDANYSVINVTNVTYASVDKKQKSIRRPSLSLPQVPSIPVVEQTLEAKLDSTYDTIGPSVSQSTVPAEPLLSHPPVEEQASSTVDGTDQTSYTYASVDMSQKSSGDTKKLPPPKPARKPPPPVPDSLPDSKII